MIWEGGTAKERSDHSTCLFLIVLTIQSCWLDNNKIAVILLVGRIRILRKRNAGRFWPLSDLSVFLAVFIHLPLTDNLLAPLSKAVGNPFEMNNQVGLGSLRNGPSSSMLSLQALATVNLLTRWWYNIKLTFYWQVISPTCRLAAAWHISISWCGGPSHDRGRTSHRTHLPSPDQAEKST